MIDIDALEKLAKAAGSDEWTASDGIVWFGDGDSALQAIAHNNLGTWPEAILSEDVAEFAAAANPAAVLKLCAEVRALRKSYARVATQFDELEEIARRSVAQAEHWKANHDNQVSRARFLIERGDIPVERVQAWGLMGALIQLETAIRHDRAIFEGTSDEDNPMGKLVTEALAAIDAARK